MIRAEISNSERGRALAWIITIVVLIAVIAGGAAMAIKFKWITPPEALASQPWMASLLPAPEETAPAEETPTQTVESSLRQQVVDLNNTLAATQGQLETMKQQVDEKDTTIRAREDEIAQLRDALNLAANQNISSVALVYEAMEPKEASVILANLGAERAALILGAMRASKAADVIALMDPTLATQITQLMAGFKPNPAAQAPVAPGGAVPQDGSGTTPPGSTPPTGPGPAAPAPAAPSGGQA
jgi:flagellar motility protein MotE (MotC chaperone)